jgi:hypothetical protein
MAISMGQQAHFACVPALNVQHRSSRSVGLCVAEHWLEKVTGFPVRRLGHLRRSRRGSPCYRRPGFAGCGEVGLCLDICAGRGPVMPFCVDTLRRGRPIELEIRAARSNAELLQGADATWLGLSEPRLQIGNQLCSPRL